MRLFLAIRPPAAAVDHLDAALADVRGAAGRILRWGETSQWHLTLAFHPAVPEGAVEDVTADARALAAGHEPFELQLAGAGEFSGRTLWIGAGGDTAALTRMLAEPWLREDPDASRRRAHLTVARVSSRAPEGRRAPRRRGAPAGPAPSRLVLGDAVRALSVYRGPSWRVEELELVASHLGEGASGGPLHEVLARVPLGR